MKIVNVGINATGRIHRHNHREEGVYEFHYYLDGAGTFENDGVGYPVKPGMLYFSRPHEIHRANALTPGPRMVNYNLSFRVEDPGDEVFLNLLEGQFQHKASLLIGKGYGLIFEDLRRKAYSEDNLVRTSAQHRFLAFTYEVLGGQVLDHAPKGQTYVDEALRVMQGAITGTLNLDELAGHLGIDKSYFIRIFKEVTGLPPLKYFLNMKMDTARYALMDRGLSIRQVAVDLGYEDEFYFSRQFKTVVGQSPTEFRASR